MCSCADMAQSPLGTGVLCLRQQHPLTATCAIKASHIAGTENEGEGVQKRLTCLGQPKDSCVPALSQEVSVTSYKHAEEVIKPNDNNWL